MLRKLLLLVLATTSITVSSQYRITGTIKGHGGRILLLAPTADGKTDTLGNVVTSNGAFKFSGKVSKPTTARIEAVNTRIDVPIFLETATFIVNADVDNPKNYTVTGGGKLQAARNDLRKKELEWNHKCDSVQSVYEAIYGTNDNLGRLQVRGAVQRMADEYEKIEDDFIRNNDNIVSANLIARKASHLAENKRLHEKYALLGENARNSIEGKLLKQYADKSLNLAVGGIAPDISLQTPDGETISIYDIKSKVKILDFWASWCGPCRAESPNVKRIYEKYHDSGLEVIGISLDTKKEAWVKAIKNDGLPWINVSDLKGWDSKAADLYEIHMIPQVYILDENNKIISTGLRGEELEEFISKAIRF